MHVCACVITKKCTKAYHHPCQLEEDWEVASIPVQAYTRKDLYVLGDLTDLESLLLASDLTLHLLLHSQHALHIKNESVKWKNIHTIIKETVVSDRRRV